MLVFLLNIFTNIFNGVKISKITRAIYFFQFNVLKIFDAINAGGGLGLCASTSYFCYPYFCAYISCNIILCSINIGFSCSLINPL